MNIVTDLGWQIASGLIVSTLMVIFRNKIKETLGSYITQGMSLNRALGWVFLFSIVAFLIAVTFLQVKVQVSVYMILTFTVIMVFAYIFSTRDR